MYILWRDGKTELMNIHDLSLVSTLLMGIGFCCAAQPTTSPVQQEMHFESQKPPGTNVDYLLFLPRGYKESKQSWPLMMFLHGSGESGTNLAKVKKHGPPKIVESDPDFQFILVSPQSTGHGWNNDALIALLDDVTAKYKVDARRIYLTGLSMGGFGTWSLAAAHPGKFAAIVPICGGGNPDKAKNLVGLPIWAFHGAKDQSVPVEHSREMVAAIRAAGGNIQYTEYPEAGHDCWTQTYANPDLYKWLLEQKR